MIGRLHALALGGLFLLAGIKSAAAETPVTTLARAIGETLVQVRPGEDGVLTVHDNMLYVQCINRPGSKTWRCEAAGLQGEPWLRNVLTTDRQQQLMDLGFKPDGAYGNFVRDFPRSTHPRRLANIILGVLKEIYGADSDSIEAISGWLPSVACHPRMISGRDRGGSIAIPHWGYATDIASDCTIATNTDAFNDDDTQAAVPGAPVGGAVDLSKRYADGMALQIKRLESGQKHIWAIFDASIPFMQCQFDAEDTAIYCEAASDDAVGTPLARILTPERRRKLIEAGFEPPGKVVNFSRLYPLAQYDEVAVAKALLAVLHDAYGYGGAPELILHTEKGDSTPL